MRLSRLAALSFVWVSCSPVPEPLPDCLVRVGMTRNNVRYARGLAIPANDATLITASTAVTVTATASTQVPGLTFAPNPTGTPTQTGTYTVTWRIEDVASQSCTPGETSVTLTVDEPECDDALSCAAAPFSTGACTRTVDCGGGRLVCIPRVGNVGMCFDSTPGACGTGTEPAIVTTLEGMPIDTCVAAVYRYTCESHFCVRNMR